MENLTFEQIITAIGIILGAATVLYTGFKAIVGLLSPFKNILDRVESAENKLKNDFEEIKLLKNEIEEIENYNHIICSTLMAITGHLISGNDICKLKEQYSKLQEYLINK